MASQKKTKTHASLEPLSAEEIAAIGGARTEPYSARPSGALSARAPRPSGVRPSAHAAKADLAPGTVLDGRWKIGKLLGAGGMGSVYTARHVRNGAEVAVKVLHPSLAQHPGQREAFLREARDGNVIDAAVRAPRTAGPGSVHAYDDGLAPNGSPYTVMERLHGTTLDDIMRRGRVAPTSAAAVAEDVLRVLESAHARGIIHRDVKPENIFITRPHGDVAVIDWGLDQHRRDLAPRTTVGTVGLAAPEQLLGRLASPASDMYGVGATTYEMLTGQLPVDRDLQLDVLQQLDRSALAHMNPSKFVSCPVRPVRDLAPNTPPELAAVVDRALRCDPAERYPSAKAMRADLERAVQAEMLRTGAA